MLGVSFLIYIKKFTLSCIGTLTHEVCGSFTDATAKDKVLHQVGNEGERHAEHTQHQVTDSQREQKEVGNCTHTTVSHQHADDEAVAQDTEEEDEAVKDDTDCLVHICE